MTMPDPPAGSATLTSQIDKLLQDAFSSNDADMGAQFLGDWIVVAEVHTGPGPVLRLVSNDDTPVWRQQGLLRFAADDLTHDVLIYRLRGGEDGEN